MDTIRLIIAGSRDFNDYELLEKEVDKFILNIQDSLGNGVPVEIVSGGARGADRLGERYAKERGLPIKQFIPNWSENGRGAGYIRNEEMAKYSSDAIIFWNQTSRGSKHMIDTSNRHSLRLKVVIY